MADRSISRTSASIALAVLALVPLGSCFLKGLVYHSVPVANAVGDSTTTLGGRKFHVIVSPRYTVLGPTPVSVNAAATALDRAYFQWYRYFGVSGTRLALVLFDHPDSLPTATMDTLRATGLLPVTYVRPKDVHDPEAEDENLPRAAAWPVWGTVARELLAAYAALRLSRPLPTDSTARDSLLDEFPQWFRGAVAGLLADPAAPDRAFDRVKDHRDALVPLTELLTRRRYDVGDTAQKSVRDLVRLIDAEGLTFALYAAEQEGETIVGKMASAFVAGGTAATALADARELPRNLTDLERRWRKWLADQS